MLITLHILSASVASFPLFMLSAAFLNIQFVIENNITILRLFLGGFI